jgi:hypothetical protein
MGGARRPMTDDPPSEDPMEIMMLTMLPVAAIGYSLLYLLFGGGFFGAIVIFFLAKALGH